MTVTVYGIPNCDTVKKARVWLDGRGVAYVFHDYKRQGADPAKIGEWIEQAGLDHVLNRHGTTYKKLPAEMKEDMEGAKAIQAMASNPSMIKRPIVEYDGGLLVGFKPDAWEAAF